METLVTVSVIIPTYNRKDWLIETLKSLAQQTLPTDRFEVIVVDDGSTDGTADVIEMGFPFTLRYFWQTNQGDAAARNSGAAQSQADVLVFLDDDILVEPNYLASLTKEHQSAKNRIVVGTEYLWLKTANPLMQHPSAVKTSNTDPATKEVAFTDVCSRNMSIRREAYYEIGMMQGLDFPGSSMWCDVDFAYRAHQQGFEFRLSTQAVCYHRDYVATSLENTKNRMQEASFRAVSLFQKNPDLPSHLPMFRDMTPVVWRKDQPILILRKLARYIASSWPILESMEEVVSILDRNHPSSVLSRPLRRWIVGGYIFRGYRKGLQQYGSVKSESKSIQA